MAKGIWVSDEERDKILRMRKDGIPVAAIAKATERSANFIYRILRKANGPATSAINQTSASVASAESNEGRDQLLRDLTDSSAALLCAVESMEVSPYEPIPMPKSVKSFEQKYNQVQRSRPGNVDANVGFAPIAHHTVKPRSVDATGEFWLLTDTTSSSRAPSASLDTCGRNQEQKPLSLQPLKKQKILTAASQDQLTSASTSSSLLPQHLATETNTTTQCTDRFNELLRRIQDEIRKLEGTAQSDAYDAQLLQMLVRFHAEILLMQLQKTLSHAKSSKRARDAEADNTEMRQLLREKLVKEIALVNVQVDRETLELERERIRHKTTSVMCRKTLLDANMSQADVKQLFSHQ